jgi:S1-C subfamily serine protease/regulator of sirC expression with transglutaminase-like and TPR domain
MLRIITGIVALVLSTTATFAQQQAVRDCESDQHELAIRACTQLIQRNPRNPAYYFNRGLSYRALNQIDQAMADQTKAIQLNPKYAAAYRARGHLHNVRRDYQLAVEDFTRAIQIEPRNAFSYNARGESHENMNALEPALEDYSRAIEINPKYARAYANRGDIWRKMGNRNNAVADYRHALSLQDNESLALAGLKIFGLTASTSAPPRPDRQPPSSGPESVANAPYDSRPPAAPGRPDVANLPPGGTPGTRPPAPSGRPGAEQPPGGGRAREGSSSSGTGFFVSASGHVLTNHHVVENCTNFNVAQGGSVSNTARVIASDSKNDLALLTSGLTPGPIPNMRSNVRLGESIFVYGFPLTGLLASSGNFTSGSVTATAGLNDDANMIQMSAPVQPGNSGGPVLDQYGNVVAVVVSKLNALRVARVTSDVPQNVNFAIKMQVALRFLDANSVTPPNGGMDGERLEPTQLAEQARAFTVQITCN